MNIHLHCEICKFLAVKICEDVRKYATSGCDFFMIMFENLYIIIDLYIKCGKKTFEFNDFTIDLLSEM